MKIILLANADQKEELTAKGQYDSAQLVWGDRLEEIMGAGADACIDLLFENNDERIKKLERLQTGITIVNAVIDPLTELPANFIRINGWNTFLKRPLIEAASNFPKAAVDRVFSYLGKTTAWLPDVAGFISARVVASVINEAYFTLEERVSTREEIDMAMKLGTNYPYGPFEWSEKIGLKNIYNLLSRLAKEQKRYEPAPLLIKEASFKWH
jgi:3-hydroxybutyryl-CoA dehydrogenase